MTPRPLSVALRTLGLIVLAATTLGLANAQTVRKKAEYQLLNTRLAPCVVLTPDAAYIVAGFDRDGPLGNVERLDLKTGKSTEVTNNLEVRGYAAAALVGDEIFLLGGVGYAFSDRPVRPVDTVESFNLVTGEVKRRRRMPNPRSHFSAVTLNGKIYAIGGEAYQHREIRPSATVDIYDPSTGTWSEGVPMKRRRHTQAVSATGFILVAGGYDGHQAQVWVELFVPSENAWKPLTDLAVKVSAHAAVVSDSKLYLFGDYDLLGRVLAYDLRTRRTSIVQTEFSPARHTGAAALGNRIVVAGGTRSTKGPFLSNVHVFEVE